MGLFRVLKKDGSKYVKYKSVFEGTPFWAKMVEEEAEQERKRKEERRGNGVCQHCGAPFAGLFTKKCTKCGKQKDY